MYTTLSLRKEDCDFVMHYLLGQCEEHNVMDLCTAILRDYLVRPGLFTTDYPTDTARFNSLLEEHEQKKTLKEQEFIRERQEEEASRPDWDKASPHNMRCYKVCYSNKNRQVRCRS